jgi:Leucine-rich repeat (LRR) protein
MMTVMRNTAFLAPLGKLQQRATRASFGAVLWMLVLLLGGGAFEMRTATAGWVGGTVWIDMNFNGIEDVGDTRIYNKTVGAGIGVKFKNLSDNKEFSAYMDQVRGLVDDPDYYNGTWEFWDSLPAGDYKVEMQLPTGWVQLIPAPDSIVHLDESNTKFNIGVQPPFTIGFGTGAGGIAIDDVTPNNYCLHPGSACFYVNGDGSETTISYRISSRTMTEVFNFTASGIQGTAKILADGTPSVTISPSYANKVRNVSLKGNTISFDIPTINGFSFSVNNESGYSTSTSSDAWVDQTLTLQISAGPDMTVKMGETVQFKGTDGNTDSRNIYWDFEDGEGAMGTLTPTHVFTTSGTYKVSLSFEVYDPYNRDTNFLNDDLTVTVLWVEIPQTETEALVALYKSTDGDNWSNNTGWLKTNTPCSWYGVRCSGGHVTGLSLGNNQLSGLLPNFSNLPTLTYLYLHNNQLNGPIPDFSNLPNLTDLGLSNNQLSGTIPNFGNLPNLWYLDLSNNQLGGTIPNFSNLPNLTDLYLSSNQLNGPLPDFSNLPNLMELYLNNNQLSGLIPNFSNLPNLIDLYLSDNQLSGPIPNLDWSSINLSSISLSSNCGLVAYDAAQETILNSQDPNWQTRSPSCPDAVGLTLTPSPILTKSQMGTTTLDITLTGNCSGTLRWTATTKPGGYITNLLVNPTTGTGTGNATVIVSYRKSTVVSSAGNAKVIVTATCGTADVKRTVNIR